MSLFWIRWFQYSANGKSIAKLQPWGHQASDLIGESQGRVRVMDLNVLGKSIVLELWEKFAKKKRLRLTRSANNVNYKVPVCGGKV